MPFIDEERLADLYSQVDQEKKASLFFQKLHLQNKAKLRMLNFFRLGFFILLALGIGFFLYLLFSADPQDNGIDQIDNIILDKTAQQDLVDHKQVATQAEIRKFLEDSLVFTVQFIAIKGDDILLFSEKFVNFRAYANQTYNAYSLGNFASREEAEAFQKELIRLGLVDTWVVAYQNGKRILED